MPCRGTNRSAWSEPRAADSQDGLDACRSQRDRPPQPCSPGICPTCVQVTCVPPLLGLCSPLQPRHPEWTRAYTHTPACAPTRARPCALAGGPFLQDTQLPVASWPRAGLGTHLEVPVDDPHLMAVQNSLQDLLDTVTAANSRRVSEGGRERQRWGMGCYVALGLQESRESRCRLPHRGGDAC